MRLKVSFKHLKHSPALEERIHEKSEKLSKYFESNITVSWVCWANGTDHWAEVKVYGPGCEFYAKACADNMYKCLDLCIEKVDKQLEKQKSKYKDRQHHAAYKTPKHLEMLERVKDEEEYQYQLEEEKSA